MAAKKVPAKKVPAKKMAAPAKKPDGKNTPAPKKDIFNKPTSRKKSKPVEPGDAYFPSKTGDMGRQRAAARMNRPDREWNRLVYASPTTAMERYNDSQKREMIANFAYGSAKKKKK